MKFFTRDLYEAMQRAATDWNRAGDAYRAHLGSMSNAFPDGARALSEDTLHDARIEAFESPSGGGELRVTLKRGYGPPSGVVLHFTGVAGFEFDDANIGRHVLYEEVDTASAGFAYRALLSNGEIFIEASNVKVEDLGTPEGYDDFAVTEIHACPANSEGDAWTIVHVTPLKGAPFWGMWNGPLEVGEVLRGSAKIFDLKVAFCPRCGARLDRR